MGCGVSTTGKDQKANERTNREKHRHIGNSSRYFQQEVKYSQTKNEIRPKTAYEKLKSSWPLKNRGLKAEMENDTRENCLLDSKSTEKNSNILVLLKR